MRRSLLLCALCACSGSAGTISFSLVFPPGETLPAETTHVRLTLEVPPNPPEVQEVVVTDGRFDLSVEVSAKGDVGRVMLEALDAGDVVLARGLSPDLPIAAYSNAFVLYMGPPRQFAEAPPADPPLPPRAELAVASLPYGVLLAGGRAADGSVQRDVKIYSVYQYQFEDGAPLPAPRAGLSAAADTLGRVYLFGGVDGSGTAASDSWAFYTTAPAPGLYMTLTSTASLARSQAAIAPVSSSTFLVTGDRPALIDGTAQAVAGLADVPAAATGSSMAEATTAAVVLGGATGVTRFDTSSGSFSTLSETETRTEAATVALPGGDVLFIGGTDGAPLASGLRATATGVTVIPLLATARRAPAAAIAGDVLVVAGGFDAAGNALPDAELFTAATLAPIATVPLVHPRGGAQAVVLPNASVLLVGGRDADGGAPAPAMEIFTP